MGAGFRLSVAEEIPQKEVVRLNRPAPSTLSGVAARYDANGDGAIDLSEYEQAIRDYFDDVITYAEMIEVVRAYLGSG